MTASPGATARNLRARLALVCCALAGGLATTAAAQDAHYWTYRYGLVGQLTGGLIVGGVSDLSATYYNPGALALVGKPRLTLNVASVQLASIEARDAAGPRLDFDSLVFDIVPSFVAGGIAETKDQKDRLAFAFLSRHDSDWDLGYSDAAVAPGERTASAGFGRVRSRLVEYWLGVTWSRRVGSDLALGVTPFLAYRAQRSRRFLVRQQQSETGQQTAFVAREFEYDHARVLAKAGLAWRPGPWELGATLTTPGVHLLFDKGKVVYNESLSEAGASRLAASTETGLDATYRSPWSVAVGLTWRGRRAALHATAEWFSEVEPYTILRPAPAPVAGSEESVPLEYRGAAKSVANVGLAVEHRLAIHFTVYAGLARNSSSWTPEAETFTAWDVNEASSGLSYARGRVHLALGVGYGWGSGDVPRPIGVPDDAAAAPGVRVRFEQWTVSATASFDRER